MEIIKNWKYNYFYDGKIKLLYYYRLSRLSRTFFGDENLLARFSSIILVCFLDENLRELYLRKISATYNGGGAAVDGKPSQVTKSETERGGALT
jgi:hypothetical protein